MFKILLLTSLFLGITAHSIYADLIETTCSATEMTVSVNVDPATMSYFVSTGTLQKLENSDIFLNNCLLQKDPAKKNLFLITTPYESCGLKNSNPENGRRIVGEIIFTRLNSSIEVACGILNSNEYIDHVDIGADLQINDIDANALVEGHFPTVLNGMAQVRFAPRYLKYNRLFPQVYAYPIKCFVYDYTNPEKSGVLVLNQGCPIRGSGRDYFLSQLYQPTVRKTATSTDIRLITSVDIFPEFSVGDEKNLGLHCDVIHCTSDTTNSLAGFPTCPIASSTCSQEGNNVRLKTGGAITHSARLPFPIKVDTTLTTVNTGLIKEPVSNNFYGNPTQTKNQVECSPKPSNTSAIIFTVVGALFIGFILGYVFAIYGSRFRTITGKIYNCRKSRQEIRSGSVLQADAAPQPYLKLDSSPATVESALE